VAFPARIFLFQQTRATRGILPRRRLRIQGIFFLYSIRIMIRSNIAVAETRAYVPTGLALPKVLDYYI
jgi:hypothetical protein